MPQMAQRLGLRTSRPQGTPACPPPSSAALPTDTSACSAALVEGCSAGRLRNQAKKTRHQTPATAANRKNTCRHDSPAKSWGSLNTTQTRGVSPPMNRADIQIAPWAKPREAEGNQLYSARVMFGNAPA